MPIATRILDLKNINTAIKEYKDKIENIRNNIGSLQGMKLLHAIKRTPMGSGPYPGVTLFEGANRILTDLVILYGIKHLLDNSIYKYTSYNVELGVESKNDFDITAEMGSDKLAGEAFNVAPSFFPSKKSTTLKKFREKASGYSNNLLLVNNDAVKEDYSPKLGSKFIFVKVDIFSGRSELCK